MVDMNKQKIIKWSKRAGALAAVFFAILSVCVLGLYVYWEVYVPYKGKCLYKEGLDNPQKANIIAQELHDKWEYKIDRKQIEDVLYNAAIKGNIQSMTMLGHYHLEGFHSNWESNEHNKEKAAYWFLKAATKGNVEAQGEIGLCYKYGKGVKQDFSKAMFWLNKGAKNKNARALYELGCIYQYGLALYNGYYNCFKGPYSNDYDYTHLIYNGELSFIARGGREYKAKEKFIEEILSQPYNIYIKPNSPKAKYYWRLAASQGLQEAKDALEKIYE